MIGSRVDVGGRLVRFCTKVRTFLQQHEDKIAIHRLRMNKPLTATDLAELERMLISHGVAQAEQIAQAKEQEQSLGLFVRSLVGLHRGAAKEAFADFLAGKALKANQLEFVNMIIDHLTERGLMNAALPYESPFTDVNSQGPDGLFAGDEVEWLVAVLDGVRATAMVR